MKKPSAARPARAARTLLRRAATLAVGAAASLAAIGHDYRAGDVRIVHPYATPSVAACTAARPTW